MGRNPLPVLNTLPFSLIIGTILGFLSGIGVGGGSLLILWLTLVLGLSPESVRGINLLFFLPCAAGASIFRIRRGTLSLRLLLPAIASGCIFAAVFSFLSSRFPVLILRKGFGILLLAAGLREVFHKNEKTPD